MTEDDLSQIFSNLMLLAQAFKSESSTICMLIDREEDVETVVKHVEMSYHDSVEIMNEVFTIYSNNLDSDSSEIEFLFTIAKELNRCIEAIDETAKDLLRYNILSLREDINVSMNACENVADKIIDIAFELRKLDKDNYSFKTVLDMQHLLNDGKKYYDTQMQNLFTAENDPVELIKWSALYKDFKNIFELCEDFMSSVAIYTSYVIR